MLQRIMKHASMSVTHFLVVFMYFFKNEIDCITTFRVKRYERCLCVHARTCGLNLPDSLMLVAFYCKSNHFLNTLDSSNMEIVFMWAYLNWLTNEV